MGEHTTTFRDNMQNQTTYPAAPGYKERGGTSQEAAQAVAASAKSMRAAVLECYRTKGAMTADEVARRIGLEHRVHSVRSRVTELYRGGFLVKTQHRAELLSGFAGRVYDYAGGAQ